MIKIRRVVVGEVPIFEPDGRIVGYAPKYKEEEYDARIKGTFFNVGNTIGDGIFCEFCNAHFDMYPVTTNCKYCPCCSEYMINEAEIKEKSV